MSIVASGRQPPSSLDGFRPGTSAALSAAPRCAVLLLLRAGNTGRAMGRGKAQQQARADGQAGIVVSSVKDARCCLLRNTQH
jgi:hypothetical protein